MTYEDPNVADEDEGVEVEEQRGTTDQGPYTGQSMDMPAAPFEPTPVEEEVVEDDNENVTTTPSEE